MLTVSQVAKGRSVQERCSDVSWSQQRHEASGLQCNDLFRKPVFTDAPPAPPASTVRGQSRDLGVVKIQAGI